MNYKTSSDPLNKDIINAIPASIYWKDVNGAYLGCNAYMLEMAQQDSVIGKTDFDLCWKKDAKQFQENDRYVIENDTMLDIEETCVTAAGKEMTMITKKIPLKDKENKTIGVLGISMDVSDRRHAQYLNGDSASLRKFLSELSERVTGQNNHGMSTSIEYAREIKDYYESIISYMPSNVYWLDKNGVLLGGNDNLAKMFGLQSRNQLVGLSYEEMAKYAQWTEGQGEAFRKAEENVMSTGIPQLNVDEPPFMMNGTMRYYMSSKAPLRNSKNEIIGVVGISTDITERKKMENALRLEKERAEAANQAKTAFLENMRHDLRTPLTGIVGFANILKEEIKDKKLSEYIDNLLASTSLLTDLIDDILESIKTSSDGSPVLQNKFDLKNKLTEVVFSCQKQCDKKDIDFSIEFDKRMPRYITGDSTRIKRIVLEIVKNALKFTEHGFVKIDVSVVHPEDEHSILKIAVEDSGIGIPLEKQGEIFEKFNRLSPSYKGLYKGAGLGLSIAKQFLDELHGKINLKSEVGKGSIFTCLIPVSIATQEDDLEMGSHEIFLNKRKENMNGQTGKIRVLLVEDDELAGHVGSVILKNFDCEVEIVTTGEAGINAVANNIYDLIFMDIGLPDTSGYEVAQKVRDKEYESQSQHVPIIALSAHVDMENKQKCIEAGMDAVLRKPLMKHVAQDILRNFVPRFSLENTAADVIAPVNNEDANRDLFNLSGEFINFNKMLSVLGNNETLAKEMLAIMVNNLPTDAEEFKKFHSQGNWKMIKDMTHKLRGSASYCGTERLKQACANLENNINVAAEELNNKLLEQLLHEITMVQDEYQRKHLVS